jgi:hypothetical protein
MRDNRSKGNEDPEEEDSWRDVAMNLSVETIAHHDINPGRSTPAESRVPLDDTPDGGHGRLFIGCTRAGASILTCTECGV